MGEGNIDSPIMLLVKRQDLKKKNQAYLFREKLVIFKKNANCYQYQKKKVYSSYSINFRTPEDRKPTSVEIKRYSIFFKRTYFNY